MDSTPKESVCAVVMIVALGYLATWGLSGFTDWGQNGSVKCEIGYDPVTSMCVDPYESECSGWSPPLFCIRRRSDQPSGRADNDEWS